MQDKLDAAAPPPSSAAAALPTAAVDRQYYKVVQLQPAHALTTQLAAMRTLVAARSEPEQRVVAFDAEWDTLKTPDGHIVGHGRIAVIQLAYRDREDKTRALVIQLRGARELPRHLLALLLDAKLKFVGRGISADLKKLGRDFRCSRATERVKFAELGTMARRRDVVQSGVVGLDLLVEVCLGQHLSKAPEVRLSKWTVPALSDAQAEYAALDVLKSLDVYFYLLPLDDLSVRLTAADAIVGATADVVPPHGSVAVLATRGAVARIVTPARWTPPAGCTPTSLKPTAARALVSVTELHAPSLVVPGVKREDKSPLTLEELGDVPFTVRPPHPRPTTLPPR